MLPFELNETVLSDGEMREEERWCCCGGGGGAKDLPLPRTRPPPSLRPDMAEGLAVEMYLLGPVQDKTKNPAPLVVSC